MLERNLQNVVDICRILLIDELHRIRYDCFCKFVPNNRFVFKNSWISCQNNQEVNEVVLVKDLVVPHLDYAVVIE